MIVLYVLAGIGCLYLLSSLFFTYLVHQMPQQPVSDTPDWGLIRDYKISAIDNGILEVWRIEPQQPSRGIVLFAHGWGRNRDRMVQRARIFANWGLTAVIHSARDHGGSSRRRFMNAVKMAEDIEAVLQWIGEPVILYGHSAGAAAAIIAAGRNPSNVELLFLEACYAETKKALLSLYCWFNRFFGTFFGPMILWWMDLFYRNQLANYDPVHIASTVTMPVMIIHGENDRRFPLDFALKLKEAFTPGQAEIYIASKAGHSDASLKSGYKEVVKSFLDRYFFERQKG